MEAWVHGPVVSSVYFMYKDYKFNLIMISYELMKFDQKALEVLNFVKEKFGKYDAKYLESLTHNQEPWLLSREGLDPDERSDKTISKQNITNYFISEIHQPDDEEWDE